MLKGGVTHASVAPFDTDYSTTPITVGAAGNINEVSEQEPKLCRSK